MFRIINLDNCISSVSKCDYLENQYRNEGKDEKKQEN